MLEISEREGDGMNYIGVDLGTSSVKLLLMNQDGVICRTVSGEYPIYYPQAGWSEQNPADWYAQMMDGLGELLKEEDKKEVAGISFGGQMHGLVVLDEKDQVIRPAILWNDGRSWRETDYLNQEIGKEKLSEYTGNIAFAGFTAPKLLWMYHNEPEKFARIKKVMLPKDYLAYRLSGCYCTDVSDASGTLYFDVKNRRWSEEMKKICHLEEIELPKVFESYEVVGTLKKEIADKLGMGQKIKIIAGAGDNAAAAVGNGTVGNGQCNISLGTSGTIFMTTEKFCVDEKNAIHSFAHADGNYHLMGCMLSAAACNKWWMEDILRDKDFAGIQQKITKLGENPVFFLPYLMGERSPHNDPDARAAFIGMAMNTTREEMLQAVLEGVTFAIRDSLEVARAQGLDFTKTRVCGGGAKSPLWKKMIANIMNMEVEVLEKEEGPGLGAAMLAAVGCGEYTDVKDAVDHVVRVKEQILPDQELAEKYEEKYRIFRELYPALVPIYKRLRAGGGMV